MRLSHNLASLNIYNEYSKAIEKQKVSGGRISSGNKVNVAKEDPNVIAQSERFRMQVRGMQMASRNSQDGLSMLQTNEGALDTMTSMVQRIRELSVKAANGTNSDGERKIIKSEINKIIEGMDDVAKNTEFNGVKLLNGGTPNSISMSIGSNVGEAIDIPRVDLISSNILNIKSDPFDTSEDIGKTITAADKALKTILDVRQKYGALENRFEDSMNILNENSDRIEGADSSIRDTDIAEEMVEFSKQNILIEAGTAMMAQSNKFPQDVLRILENVKSR